MLLGKRKRRYQTVEVTNLMTGVRSYKIYETRRGRLIDRAPVLAGIPTREEALIRLQELEDAAEEQRA